MESVCYLSDKDLMIINLTISLYWNILDYIFYYTIYLSNQFHWCIILKKSTVIERFRGSIAKSDMTAYLKAMSRQ